MPHAKITPATNNLFKPKNTYECFLCMYNIYFNKIYTLIFFVTSDNELMFSKTFTNKSKYIIWDLDSQQIIYIILCLLLLYSLRMWSFFKVNFVYLDGGLGDVQFQWKFHPTVNPVVKDGKRSGECMVYLN